MIFTSYVHLIWESQTLSIATSYHSIYIFFYYKYYIQIYARMDYEKYVYYIRALMAVEIFGGQDRAKLVYSPYPPKQS